MPSSFSAHDNAHQISVDLGDDRPDVSRGAPRSRPRQPPATIDAEIAVVGGGAAGLAASIALARSRRRVVVIDAGHPRNAVAHGAHNVLGNEGISPLELLARGRAEAEAYGVQILHGRATDASGTIDDFTVEVDAGASLVHARRVILASGLIDDLPTVPGVREGWGTSVLHCPFCHGWEIRDQRIGILTRDEIAVHHAMLFRQLSDDVTLFLHDAADPTKEQSEQLAALDVRVVRPRVDRLILDGRQVKAVQIDGGDRFEMDAIVIAPKYNVRTELFEALGGEAIPTPSGRQIQADPRGATAVPGVFTAGSAGRAGYRYPCEMVHNLHEREIDAPVDEVGILIDSLAAKDDRLWPRNEWPAMRLDRPLQVGARGGHGPVRYFITDYEPGRRVEFQFTGPKGFNGCHSFTAISQAESSTLLRHELVMSPSGTALFTWPLFYRPMHDALIEECLDRAELACGAVSDRRTRRSLWVTILRAPFSARLNRRRKRRP